MQNRSLVDGELAFVFSRINNQAITSGVWNAFNVNKPACKITPNAVPFYRNRAVQRMLLTLQIGTSV